MKALNDQGTPEGALAAARQIADAADTGERIIGVIVHEASDPELRAVREVYSGLNLLVIAPSSSIPLPARIDDPRFLRISATNKSQAFQAANLLKRLDRRHAVVVYTATPYGETLAGAFEEATRGLDLELVASVKTKPEGLSYSHVAKEVKKAGADGVFFAGGSAEAVVLLSDLYDVVFRGAFVAADRAFTDAVADELGCKAEGIYAASVLPDPTGVMSASQLARYSSLEFREPGLYSVAGYSGVELVVKASEKASSWDATAAGQAARDLDVDTLVGNVSYDSAGELTAPRIYFFRVGGGRFGQALALPPLRVKPSAVAVKSLVLVADFVNERGSADSGGRKAARAVVESLGRRFDDDVGVEVRPLGKAVTLEDGARRARELGEEQSAVLLIWGLYSGKGESLEVMSRFEVFDRPEINRALGRVAIAQIASFGLQKQNWQRAAWLTEFVHGLVQYWRGFYGDALSDFETVRTQALGALGPDDQRTLLLYLGNSQLFSVLGVTSVSIATAVTASDARLVNTWTRSCGSIPFESELPPKVMVDKIEVVEKEVPTKVEQITITARCKANPPTEDWRCNNFKFALADVNAALLEEGDSRQIRLEIIQDNKFWDDYKRDFVVFSDAFNPPDIMLAGHEDIGEWAQKGLIIPLDDFIAQQSAVYHSVIDGLWPSVTFQGKRWAVPQDAEARPLYWSKPLLRKLGWSNAQIKSLPERIKSGDFTLQDMLETAKEAVDKGVVKEGFGFWHRPRNGPDFWEYYYDMGGETLDAATGKLVYDKEVGLKHFKFFEDATQNLKVLVTNVFDYKWSDWHTLVSPTDKILFWAGGTWNWGDWAKNYVKDRGGQDFLFENIGFGLIPAAEKGGKPITLTHPLTYTISSQSKHPDLAFRLITSITNDEANTRHAVGSAHLGLLKTQVDYEPYAKDRFLTETLYMLEFTTFLPNNPNWRVYSDTWFEGLQAVEAGEMTAAAAVDFVIDRMKAKLGDRVIIR